MPDIVETAWLVEHGPTHAPAYLGLKNGNWSFTMDAFKAFRCARREDAEALALWHEPSGFVRVAEHTLITEGQGL